MKTTTIIILAALSCLAPTAFGEVLQGPVTNAANGHVYYLLSPGSWTHAQAEAVQLGGNLATINDEAENTWVLQTFATTNSDVWIGYSRPPQGSFSWVSGEVASYTNWRAGEPNNATGNEYYALLYSVLTSNRPPPGSWNDGPNTFTLNAVVESVPSTAVGTATNAVIWPAVEIGWLSESNKMYQVQWASRLAPTVWFNFGSVVPGNGTTNIVFDSTRGRDKRFYQVLTLE
jgi:hypothetical protein